MTVAEGPGVLTPMGLDRLQVRPVERMPDTGCMPLHVTHVRESMTVASLRSDVTVIRSRRPLLLLCLLLAWGGASWAAHITDKLVVGIYAEPAAEGQPIRLLSSGVPLEVLRHQGDFVEVRLTDDLRGWVEGRYVTDEKPAKAMLLETQLKLRALNDELQRLRAGGASLEEQQTGPPAVELAPNPREAELEDALGKAETRIGELERELRERAAASAAERELDELRAKMHAVTQILADAQDLTLGRKDEAPKPGMLQRHATWLVGLGALVLGFVLGVALIDYRIRKRYGGFRI